MADSLIFKGQKTVIKQTGDEMLLARPKRGGDTFQVKKWWGGRANTVYLTCAKFLVTTGSGTIELVIPVDSDSVEVGISHDGSGGFTFTGPLGIERIGVFEVGGALIKEYIIPSNITLPIQEVDGGGSLPAPIPTIGTVTVAPASSTVNVGDSVNYTATISGDAADAQYAWSSSAGVMVTGSGSAVAIQFDDAETHTITCTVTSATASDSGASGTETATATVSFADRVAAADFSYAVTVDGGVYELNGVANAGVAGAPGDVFHFDLSDASLSGHPFKIYTDPGKTTEVTVGVEQEGDDLLFTPPIAGTFSYQCANHEGMGGDLTIS